MISPGDGKAGKWPYIAWTSSWSHWCLCTWSSISQTIVLSIVNSGRRLVTTLTKTDFTLCIWPILVSSCMNLRSKAGDHVGAKWAGREPQRGGRWFLFRYRVHTSCVLLSFCPWYLLDPIALWAGVRIGFTFARSSFCHWFKSCRTALWCSAVQTRCRKATGTWCTSNQSCRAGNFPTWMKLVNPHCIQDLFRGLQTTDVYACRHVLSQSPKWMHTSCLLLRPTINNIIIIIISISLLPIIP